MKGVVVRGKEIKKRAVDLALPHMGNKQQKRALAEAVEYAKGRGVELNLIKIR